MQTPNAKILQKPHTKKHNYHGFTLVELIVVITILVILGTIAFLNLGGFQSNARDSLRIENLSNLQKGLTVFQIKSGVYPMPEGSVTITASGTDIGYQGFAKDLVGSIAKLSQGGTVDPLDSSISPTYGVNASKTKMQLMNFLEDGSNVTAFIPNTVTQKLFTSDSLISEASASTTSDYSKRSPKTTGDTLGILLSTATGTLNQPVQESGSGVDIVLTNSGYMAVFGKGNSVSGSGNVLSVVSSMGAKSCNDLLSKDGGKKNKDGVYYINPTGTSSSSGIFQVYCDMTTDGGGWSLIVRIKADGTGNHGSGSSMGLLMNPSQNNLAKLSDVTINQIKSEGVFRLTCRDKTGYYKLVDGIWNSRHETTYGSNQILGSSSYVGSYIATGHDSGSSYGLSNYIYSGGINPFGWHQNYFPQSYPSEGAPNFGCYETTVGWGGDGVVWVK